MAPHFSNMIYFRKNFLLRILRFKQIFGIKNGQNQPTQSSIGHPFMKNAAKGAIANIGQIDQKRFRQLQSLAFLFD